MMDLLVNGSIIANPEISISINDILAGPINLETNPSQTNLRSPDPFVHDHFLTVKRKLVNIPSPSEIFHSMLDEKKTVAILNAMINTYVNCHTDHGNDHILNSSLLEQTHYPMMLMYNIQIHNLLLLKSKANEE